VVISWVKKVILEAKRTSIAMIYKKYYLF